MSFRGVLLHFASHPEVRRMVSDSSAARRLSKRWIPGEKVEDALAAVKDLNAAGISATLDHLGENVATEKEAHAECETYLGLLDQIQQQGLNSNVSLKLTQVGLDLSPDLCRENLAAILSRAAQYSSFVRVDMEGSAYTERTLAMVHEMHRRF